LLKLLTSASFAVLAAGLLVATVVDLRTRRIPNILTGGMVSAGLGLAAFGIGGISVGAAVLGCVIGLVLMLPGFALGATGAGDVKLMAAVGSLLGPLGVIYAVLYTAIVGGMLAVIVSLERRRLGAALAGTGRMIASPGDVKSEIASATPASRFAYGPAIAAGSIIAALLR
jgi:prepilin peptidase CpaA